MPRSRAVVLVPLAGENVMRSIAHGGLMFMCLTLLIIGRGCSPHHPADDDGSNDSFDSYVPDPDVYCTPPDPDRLIRRSLPGGRTVEFAVNQMIVLMNEGTERSEVEQLAASLGGAIIGQMPDIDFYQIEVPATTQAELDALIDQVKANPVVTSAGYNGVPQFDQTCPAQSDNRDIAAQDQCSFAETEYYQAVTMFDFFRQHLTLYPVRVGVIDSGVDPSTHEFDDVSILYLNDIAGRPEDTHPHRHGTAVAGIIAADNDFVGVNGIASRLIGDRLRLIVGRASDDAGVIVYTGLAAAAGADVINLSFGWSESDPHIETVRNIWVRLMQRHSGALFVCAAGNESTELTGLNHAPGGIGLSNVLTVAATAQCNPTQLSTMSNYGIAVDIAAPGENVPVVAPDGTYVGRSGTSFSAPMVAALAAVLKSIDPTLTPARLKHHIAARGYPLADGSPFGRIVFTTSIQELLLDMGVGDPIRSWIDPVGRHHAEASGLVLSRLCPPGMYFTIDGYGLHSVQAGGGALVGAIGGPAAPPAFCINAQDGEVYLEIAGPRMGQFALGSYSIERIAIGGGVAGVSFQDHGSIDAGPGVSGTLTFETCRIDQRDPWGSRHPMIVYVTGGFEGFLEVTHSDGGGPTLNEFEGGFNMPLVVSPNAGDEVFEYLENNCEGGIPTSPTEP